MVSKKALKAVFGDRAADARAVLDWGGGRHQIPCRGTDDNGFPDIPERDVAEQRIRECYNPPDWHDVAMHVLDAMAGTYGVEAIEGDSVFWPAAEYLNTGDTYRATLVYDFARDRFSVESWGDWLEKAERRGLRFV